jgi:acyl-CoA synthetase (AMP-forming)/AMP-acid ligase II
MSKTNKTFTVAGVSTLNGVTKPRFASDIKQRTFMLTYTEHTAIKLVELPFAMTKIEAVQHLQTLPEFADETSAAALSAFVSKVTPKEQGKRGRPMKLPTLDDVPVRESGKFLSKAVRQERLDALIEEAKQKVAERAAARAARAAKKAAAATEAPAATEEATA